MSEWKKCPACGATLPEPVTECPFCGLTGLSYCFFTKRDYEEWVRRIVKPHQAKLIPRVSVGAGHGLILFASGDLYGIGSNDTGQLGELSVVGEKAERPRRIASGVSAAAAGRDYSILVRNGQAELLGAGEYTERFTGFSQAAGAAVYASGQYNVFWIRDGAGNLYAFGDNALEMVEPRKKEKIHTFNPVKARVRYDAELREYGTAHEQSYTSATTDAWAVEKGIRDQLMADAAYRKARQRYGGNNLEIQLKYAGRKLLSGNSLDCPVHTEQREYTGRLFFDNKRIYRPVRCTCQYEPHPVFMGSGLLKKTDDDRKEKDWWKNARKIVFAGNGGLFVLTAQGKLYYRKKNEKHQLEENVADLSAVMSTMMIAKTSGEILYGTLQNPAGPDAVKKLRCFRITEGHF